MVRGGQSDYSAAKTATAQRAAGAGGSSLENGGEFRIVKHNMSKWHLHHQYEDGAQNTSNIMHFEADRPDYSSGNRRTLEGMPLGTDGALGTLAEIFTE